MESGPFLLTPITYIIYSNRYYPGIFQNHRTFQRNKKNRPEVMAGTSVSTLSKVGSTSSVLETSFNYVWGKSQWILVDVFLVVPGGERVSHFFKKYLRKKLSKTMGTVELEDIEVGSVGMNSQNMKWYFWKKDEYLMASWISQEKVQRQNSNLNPPSS